MSRRVARSAWPVGADGGVPRPDGGVLPPQDEELVEDLDLLEELDGAGELEWLEELSQER